MDGSYRYETYLDPTPTSSAPPSDLPASAYSHFQTYQDPKGEPTNGLMDDYLDAQEPESATPAEHPVRPISLIFKVPPGSGSNRRTERDGEGSAPKGVSLKKRRFE